MVHTHTVFHTNTQIVFHTIRWNMINGLFKIYFNVIFDIRIIYTSTSYIECIFPINLLDRLEKTDLLLPQPVDVVRCFHISREDI